MGNVAIAFIESTISLSSYVEIKRQKRIELKRIRSLIPRYLARLNDCDISITTLNLNGLGVDNTILRLLSCPLLSGETRVQELYLEHNWIGPEGMCCYAALISICVGVWDIICAVPCIVASSIALTHSTLSLSLSLFISFSLLNKGATCIARLLSRDNHLKNVSLAHNPGEWLKQVCPKHVSQDSLGLERYDMTASSQL